MDTVVFVDSQVVNWVNSNVVFVKVNGEGDSTTRYSFTDFAKSYKIKGYPSFILMKPDGEIIERSYGMDPKEFVDTYTDYVAGRNTLADLADQAEKTPSPELFFKLGNKYDEHGQDSAAMVNLVKAYQTDSTNEKGIAVQALISVGLTLRGQKKYDEALEKFQMVLSRFPSDSNIPDAELMIGGCYRRKGDTATAIAHFEKWLGKYPDNASAPSVRETLAGLKPATVDSTKK